MKKVNNMDEMITYIENIPKFTEKHPLAHTAEFLKKMSIDPEKKNEFKIIHIAGTNGKGSVSAMISNILEKANIKVGLFISPHLVKYNERIKINNKDVSDEVLLEAFESIMKLVETMKALGYSHPTYFEFLFLMGMYIFKNKGVEYVVLETGLGGRLDATNCFAEPSLSIITSIGMDHMEYLGDTIEKIAYEKAGIIKENVPVVCWTENEIVKKVVTKIANSKNSRLYSVEKKDYKIATKTNKTVDFCVGSGYYLHCTFQVPFISEYQVQNAMLVINGINSLNITDNLDIDFDTIYDGLATVFWEGRMEQVGDGIILDGAHNEPGINEFVKTFNEYECTGKKKLVFSVVKDKEYEDMVAILARTSVSKVYIATLASYRALSGKVIEEDFRKYNSNIEVSVFENVCDAYDAAISEKTDDDVIFCVGSLYLIGEIKKHILKL